MTHELLNNVHHKNLRVDKTYARGMGYDTNTVRVFPSEFASLQMEYPIFLVKSRETGHFEPVALLGFDDGENLYLDDETGWDAACIPLAVQRQPFLIGFQQQEVDGIPNQVPVVHIDIDHPSVNESRGEALFLEHGGETEFLQSMSAVLMAIHEGHQVNEALSKLLVGLDLVESLTVEIEFNDGKKHGLSGLYSINEDKLRELNGGALEALHKKGYLHHVYMMLASIPNLRRLIEKKNSLIGQ